MPEDNTRDSAGPLDLEPDPADEVLYCGHCEREFWDPHAEVRDDGDFGWTVFGSCECGRTATKELPRDHVVDDDQQRLATDGGQSEPRTTQLVNLRDQEDNKDLNRLDVTRIDRSSSIGNPHRLEKDGGDYTRQESVMAYAADMDEQLSDDDANGLSGEELRDYLDDLRGETLGCWCVPELCHGHVVLYWLDTGNVPDDASELRDWGAPERTQVTEVPVDAE